MTALSDALADARQFRARRLTRNEKRAVSRPVSPQKPILDLARVMDMAFLLDHAATTDKSAGMHDPLVMQARVPAMKLCRPGRGVHTQRFAKRSSYDERIADRCLEQAAAMRLGHAPETHTVHRGGAKERDYSFFDATTRQAEAQRLQRQKETLELCWINALIAGLREA